MITLTLILSFIFRVAICPPHQELYIPKSEPINIYDNLIKAIITVESNNGKYLYNEFEGAVGYFQIRQCRIDDYNNATGLNHALNDCYDYELSRKVFLYYTKGRSFETISRAWCSGEHGTKRASQDYWNKVKKLI